MWAENTVEKLDEPSNSGPIAFATVATVATFATAGAGG